MVSSHQSCLHLNGQIKIDYRIYERLSLYNFSDPWRIAVDDTVPLPEFSRKIPRFFNNASTASKPKIMQHDIFSPNLPKISPVMMIAPKRSPKRWSQQCNPSGIFSMEIIRTTNNKYAACNVYRLKMSNCYKCVKLPSLKDCSPFEAAQSLIRRLKIEYNSFHSK